ncbi:unnamed protein product [Allacma fusca]|uniref:Protein polybromo-1 n=1 Tax=Allacma fusca TaxID=39272 RepID=A0A8J2PWK0_9HEXA|nr:unnamed protein product [Allacma fusca]
MSSTASVASRGEDDTASLDLDYQPELKRKKVARCTDPTEQCQQLYDIIRNHKKEDGTVLCEAFIRAPKRRQEPAYYEVVNNVMDMLRIQQKIKMEEYEDIEQMSADVDLMVQNAKAFYKKSSQENKDACDLWDFFIESKCRLFDQDSQSDDGKGKIILKMGKLARRAAAVEARKPINQELDGGETSESSTTTDRQDDSLIDGTVSAALEELFSAVMVATDTDGRLLHSVFQLLPSKKRYPTYYNLIENPIDLKMIATKIQTGDYNALAELEKDLLLMCRNACLFNEPGSQIYKDAKSLKKIVTTKRVDIEHGRTANYGATPGKTSERIRNRKLRSGLSHSAITAALQYEEDEDEDEEMEEIEEEQEDEEMADEDVGDEEEDEEDPGDSTNPMWILYETVANVPSSDPFKRLPSKRYYPDYYSEIKNPISLSKIRLKIKNKEYLNLTQVQADMNVMFENAKAYNRPDSHLYKTAVKLQKLMQIKVQELLTIDDDSESEDPPIIAKSSLGNIAIVCNPVESDSDTNPGTGSNNSSFNEASNSSFTPLVASKSPSPVKKTKAKTVKEPNVITTPGPSFNKTKAQIKDEKNANLTSPKELLRRRFTTLYRTLVDYQEPDNRVPITIFMEKPSKKLYPSYYKIITEPIDMLTIENNIKIDKYGTTDELLKDFNLMFDNCRLYNEEGSMIYEDANKLEKLLLDKIKELGPEVGFRTKPKKFKKNPVLTQKMRKYLDIVRDNRDAKGRQLSFIFQKLPSKMEYPEYYEVIKNPIDMDRMYQKLKTNMYESLDHLAQDLMTMFNNAYKFNEPDSQIYKDALVLQRLALQTKLNLSEDDDGIPDVRTAVREIILSVFTSVYHHQDEEGRCYTDTLAELPEFDELEGQRFRGLTLDLIKSRMDRGYYKRLDAFQKDVFLCLERCRNLSRSDSQLFEDSIELQSYFIRIRDEICDHGKVLRSPALKYTKADLDKSVEVLREDKKKNEIPLEDPASLAVKKEEVAASSSSQSESYNEQTYNIGDFVYIRPTTGPGYNNPESTASEGSFSGIVASKLSTLKPNVVVIQKLWTEPDGTKMFEGIYFFRPDQTYHIPTRKFLQKELFRSEIRSSHQLSEIIGKCWVMTVKGKEYFHYAPEGYGDEDVYVCEYRYSSRGRCFTKLKTWAFSSDRVQLVPRPKSLEPVRVASIFRDRVEKHKEDLLSIEEDVLEKIPKEEFQYSLLL